MGTSARPGHELGQEPTQTGTGAAPPDRSGEQAAREYRRRREVLGQREGEKGESGR